MEVPGRRSLRFSGFFMLIQSNPMEYGKKLLHFFVK